MKKATTLFGLLFLAAMTWSCSKNDEGNDPEEYKSMILGTWKASSINYSSYVNGQNVSVSSEDPDNLADYIITFYLNGTTKYESDGLVTYKIEGNKLTIYESDDPDDTDVLDIISISKTQMVLQIVEETTQNGKNYKNVEEDVLVRVN